MLSRDKVDQAMRITQEFGPNRSVPRDIRLRECCPDMDERLESELFEYCDRVEKEALSLAQRINEELVNDDEAKQMLAELFPLLERGRVEKAIEQAQWFCAK